MARKDTVPSMTEPTNEKYLETSTLWTNPCDIINAIVLNIYVLKLNSVAVTKQYKNCATWFTHQCFHVGLSFFPL